GASDRASGRPSRRWPSTASVSPIPTPTEPMATATTIVTSRRIAPPPSRVAARVSDGPTAMDRAVAEAVAAARIGLGSRLGVDRPYQGLEAVHDARPWSGDHLVIEHDHDPSVLDRGHVAPTLAGGDAGGGDW